MLIQKEFCLVFEEYTNQVNQMILEANPMLNAIKKKTNTILRTRAQLLMRKSISLAARNVGKDLMDIVNDSKSDFNKYVEMRQNIDCFNWPLMHKILYRYLLKCLHRGHFEQMMQELKSQKISLSRHIDLRVKAK